MVIVVLVPALLLTGCTGSTSTAGRSIARWFVSHSGELTGGAGGLKLKAQSLVDDGLRDAAIAASRDAELQAVKNSSHVDEALTSVCNISVDFSAPPPDDSADMSAAETLMHAVSAEMPGSGMSVWSERIVTAYEAVWGESDQKLRAQATLTRDFEVTAFQHAYCTAR